MRESESLIVIMAAIGNLPKSEQDKIAQYVKTIEGVIDGSPPHGMLAVATIFRDLEMELAEHMQTRN